MDTQSYQHRNQTASQYVPSLYAKYIHERLGKSILERPEGFVTYSFLGDSMYIEDIFVLPEHRRSGVGTELANAVIDIAKSKGYNKIIGTVLPTANGSTDSLKALLWYGFQLHSLNGNLIVLTKEV